MSCSCCLCFISLRLSACGLFLGLRAVPIALCCLFQCVLFVLSLLLVSLRLPLRCLFLCVFASLRLCFFALVSPLFVSCFFIPPSTLRILRSQAATGELIAHSQGNISLDIGIIAVQQDWATG